MLRIERSANGPVVFTLSGRMQTEDIEQFLYFLNEASRLPSTPSWASMMVPA